MAMGERSLKMTVTSRETKISDVRKMLCSVSMKCVLLFLGGNEFAARSETFFNTS